MIAMVWENQICKEGYGWNYMKKCVYGWIEILKCFKLFFVQAW